MLSKWSHPNIDSNILCLGRNHPNATNELLVWLNGSPKYERPSLDGWDFFQFCHEVDG